VSVFSDLRDDLAAKLVAAGVPASTNPASNVPVVLVDLLDGPPPTSRNLGVGAWPVLATLKIVAAPPADLAAGTWLEDTLELTLRTLGRATWRQTTVSVGAKDCPAYVLEYDLEVTNPDC
jgi:hypothetical protein